MEPNRVSTPPQSAHTGPAAHTTRNKASAPTAPSDAAGAAAGAGGFLSLLSALDDSLNGLLDAPLVSGIDPGLVPVDDKQLPVADAAALMALLAGNIVPVDTSQGGKGEVDVAQGASTLSLVQGGTLPGVRDQSLASLQADFLPPGGLVAQTARLDAASDTSVLDGQNPVAGYKRAFSRLQSVLSSSLAGTSTAALATGQRSAGSEKQFVPTALASGSILQTAPERRDAALSSGSSMPRTGLEVAAAPALAAQVGPLPTPEASVLVRATGDKAGPEGLTDVWGAASAGPEAVPSPDGSVPVAEPDQAAAEEALAEQVAYWVSENLQNAELTVTHEGNPVEVSVSMSGKEAHIVFGSDQSETRDLLDASVAQLRDLLQSEGLTLSGMTVGESGARNANTDGDGDASRGRKGGRQAQVLAPVAEAGTPRPRILTDRAVDVFV